MKKISNWIANHSILLVTIFLILLIPSIYGYLNTDINYDILSYLPSDIETIKGQNILSKDFGIGGFSFVFTNELRNDKILNLEEKIKEIDGVEKVLSIASISDVGIPISMFPDEVLERITQDGETILFVAFRTGMSDEITLQGIEKLRSLTKDNAVSGMSAMILDTRKLSESEMTLYIIFAVLFCLVVLLFATDSYIIPFFLLANIGISILLNMGSNLLLGEISYITKSITAVLQLGVTMDFSIFLYHKYEEARSNCKNKQKAMEKAILETFQSVIGSSLTTIAGFLALCGMNLTLGKDIGLVMAKGVLCGLFCVFTLFPALLLVFDNLILKTKHKKLLPNMTRMKEFICSHYKIIILVFCVLAIPAVIGNSKVEVYYKLDNSLPEDLPSRISNSVLSQKFHIVSPQIVLLDKDLSIQKLNELTEKLKEIPGIDMVLTSSSITSLGIPLDLLPEEIVDIIQNDCYQLVLLNSTYEVASSSLNSQIDEINLLLKSYDSSAILAGEGALTKDLVEIADHDFLVVNYLSIGIIFVLMLVVLKSFSLPFLLIVVILLAIFLNMAVAYFSQTTLPFIASIVVGTIQLGATIDYAILISTTYLEERKKEKDKFLAMNHTLDKTVSSILVSASCFFAATVGVFIVSKIDMIASICNLLSRGAIISMVVVIFLLPSLLLLFDTIILKTTYKKKEGI